MRIVPFCIGLTAVAAMDAGALTLQVPAEYATIQAGVDAAVAGDTVLVAPGVYSDIEVRMGQFDLVSACVFVKDGVLLTSEGGPAVTSIDRMWVDTPEPPFTIHGTGLTSPETLIEGFTITQNPPGTEGVRLQGFNGQVTIRNCVFVDLPGGGAAIAFGSARFENCTITTGGARGILGIASTLEIYDCLFEGNSPGVRATCDNTVAPAQALIVRNSIFRNNTHAEGAGIGATRCLAGVVIEGCTFENNTALESGGGSRR